MTQELSNPTREYVVGRYTYHRDSDGCDDIWLIHGPDVPYLDGVRFWDDGDGVRAEAARVEARRLTYGYALLDTLKGLLAAANELPRDAWTPGFRNAAVAASLMASMAEEGVRP